MVVPHSDLVSPRRVAQAIGVSESSLKRWCDQGLLATVRTAGGHRKLAIADVLRFVREHDQRLVAPEILELPPASQQAALGLARGRPGLVAALLAGNEILARQIVLELYLAGHRTSVICDEVLAAAFHDIGDRWACQEADVYQERRGCEIAMRILFDLRRIQPSPDRARIAAGGTPEGDFYTLPSTMVELVLRDAGYCTMPLGQSLPWPSLVRAVTDVRPALFWLSVSHLADPAGFVAGFGELSAACRAANVALVVGGRALSAEWRSRLTYSAYCDTLQHLDAFAQTLTHAARPAPRARPAKTAESAGKQPAAQRPAKSRKEP